LRRRAATFAPCAHGGIPSRHAAKLLYAGGFPALAQRLQKIVMEDSQEPFMERAERGRTHPILIAAGVAVLLFSLLGAASIAFAAGDHVRIVDGTAIERA
jgi:hypothetical protein